MKNSIHKLIIRGGGQQHYDLVDFLKGFSIFTIVLMHLIQIYLISVPNIIFKASALGGAGVHIFIVCSGIGLYMSYRRNPPTFIQFIIKRFTKIYIPYTIVVIISSLIPFMYEGNDRIVALLSHIFLFKMFVPVYESSFGGQLWYISTLFQLYLVFIPLCKLKENLSNRKKFFFVFLIVSIIWWVISCFTGISKERIWGSFFLQYIWEFALGICIADYLEDGNDIMVNKSILYIFACAGLIVFGAMSLNSGFLKTFNDIFSVIGYGGLAVSIFSLGIGWVNKLGFWISKISYEWYLVHILIFSTVFYIIPAEGLTMSVIVGIIALAVSIAVAYLYHKGIVAVRSCMV